MNAPFQWTKQVASHWGGTRNGTIVHWPDGITEKGGLRVAVHPRDRRRPHDPRGRRAARSRRWSTACCRPRSRARACSTRSTTPTPPERHDLQYFEMFGNRGIYHQGWSAVTKHKTPWVMVGGDMPAVRRRRLGALRRRQRRLQPGPRPRRRAARAAGRAAAAVADRGREVQRAAARRPSGRAPQPRPRRPTDAHPRHLPAVLPGHGPAVGEQRREHQEQVVLDHRRGRRARRRRRGRDHRPGRPLRRLGRVRRRTGCLKFAYNVLGIHEFTAAADDADPGRAPTRCAWSSRTTAAAWPRAATSRSSTTATEVGEGRVEVTQPMIFSADETTDIGYESGTTVTADYTATRQPVHRQDPLGPARHRRRRQRPLHRPRGTAPRRHGPAVVGTTSMPPTAIAANLSVPLVVHAGAPPIASSGTGNPCARSADVLSHVGPRNVGRRGGFDPDGALPRRDSEGAQSQVP